MHDYYIIIGGRKVPVNEDVYRAFMRPVWSETWRKRNHNNEASIEALTESGAQLASATPPVDEIVEEKLTLEMLYLALETLTTDERNIIDALFFKEKSERELARNMGIPRNTLAYRKAKILEKLKKLLEK